jgi:hypothetical protein
MSSLVRWLVGCGAVAFVGLGSCSSDDEKPAGRAGASGGPSGGSSGAGGEGGRPGTGGTSGATGGTAGGLGGEGGGDDGGAGGAGGTPMSCEECTASSCSTLLEQCDESPLCAPWFACANDCTTEACVESCSADNDEVEPHFAQILACMCSSCVDECAELGPCDHGCEDDLDLPLLMTPPATLGETGLYASANAPPDQLAPYVRVFRPEYQLWSDGAEKQRWVYLPRCSQIDTSDMDHWSFPVGARFWKEFRVQNSAGMVRIETRFIHRYGPGAGNWIFAAYQWDPNVMNPTAANTTHVPDGVVDANGTTHNIPTQADCNQCHNNGLQERILGFSAIQLSHTFAGVTIAALSDEGWLSVPARDGFDPPGNTPTQEALGYLHANCGNCHNPGTNLGEGMGREPARMRLLVGHTTVAATDTVTTLLGVPTVNQNFNTLDRIEPCDAANSSIIVRMNRRLPDMGQMPQIGTEVSDMTGIATVSNWIDTLSANSGQSCP